MKITVVGASGMMGSKVVRELERDGQDVTQASTRTGVDAFTGHGLAAAFADAEVVIDLTDTGSFGNRDALEFFRQAGKNMLRAAKEAGVGHYIALSVVGTDRLVENDYFRAKMVQENLVRASGLPHTIIRSTQFLEYFEGIINSTADERGLRLPPAMVQPIAADETATWISRIAVGAARRAVIEIAGPEAIELNELARELLTATQDPRPISVEADAPYFGVELAKDTLLPNEHALEGTVTFHDWLYRAVLA
ncbi:SDR family oxidoreductase [Ferirhizobium litorale]